MSTAKARKATAKPAAKRPSSTQLDAHNAAAGIPIRPGEVHSEVMTITPETAEQWLTRNTHNRPVRQARVDDLIAAIKRGEWRLNGDAIRFAADGTLLDGQHRLWAIWLAGDYFGVDGAPAGADSLVITGLPLEAQETMDTGAKRNLKDALALRGVHGGTRLAAAVTYIWRVTNGKVRTATAKPSISEGVAMYLSDPEAINEASRVAERVRARFRCSASMFAGAYYVWATIDQEAADVFVERLIDGVGLEEGSPILALRRYLERQVTAGAGTRSSNVTLHALANKAWNAYRDGEFVTTLSWKATGARAEAFPEAR